MNKIDEDFIKKTEKKWLDLLKKIICDIDPLIDEKVFKGLNCKNG